MRYSKESKNFLRKVQKEFEIYDLGFSTEMLGIQLRMNAYKIYLSTKKGEEKIIDEYEIHNSNMLGTRLPSGFKIAPLRMVPDAVVIDKYRRLLGALLYLSRFVRYDICFFNSLMARYASNHYNTL